MCFFLLFFQLLRLKIKKVSDYWLFCRDFSPFLGFREPKKSQLMPCKEMLISLGALADMVLITLIGNGFVYLFGQFYSHAYVYARGTWTNLIYFEWGSVWIVTPYLVLFEPENISPGSKLKIFKLYWIKNWITKSYCTVSSAKVIVFKRWEKAWMTFEKKRTFQSFSKNSFFLAKLNVLGYLLNWSNDTRFNLFPCLTNRIK